MLLCMFLGLCCCVVFCYGNITPSLTPQQLKDIDGKIVSFLDKPTNATDWDIVLKDIEHIIQQLKLYKKLMRDGNDQDIVTRSFEIYQTGKPKFIYHSMSEPEIRDAAQVTNEQLTDFHVLRDNMDNLWDEFLDVISEKTGETLVYEFPPGFESYNKGGYGGEDDTPGYGRGWGWQGSRGGEYGRGRGRGRGRRRGGGGYGNDFGPPF